MFGTVNWYNRLGAYGFVLPDDETLPDHYVSPKFILGNYKFLLPGWRVEFDAVEVNGKPQAHNVRIIAKPIARQVSDPTAVTR